MAQNRWQRFPISAGVTHRWVTGIVYPDARRHSFIARPSPNVRSAQNSCSATLSGPEALPHSSSRSTTRAPREPPEAVKIGYMWSATVVETIGCKGGKEAAFFSRVACRESGDILPAWLPSICKSKAAGRFPVSSWLPRAQSLSTQRPRRCAEVDDIKNPSGRGYYQQGGGTTEEKGGGVYVAH